jgi:BirA family biotin operon repressor/biotin-[acetyl-CoA-carboxylase] ligase
MHRVHFAEIDSTNAEALRRVAAGEVGWMRITADRQTAGRGRRGRAWISPQGNLHASFIVPVTGAPGFAKPWQIGFAAALAILDVVSPVLRSTPAPRIKWPNDVTLGGAKLAGLLVEGAGGKALVIGIGINLASAPDGTPYPTTFLARHTSVEFGAGSLADALEIALRARVATFASHGFCALRQEVLASSHSPGDALSISTGAHGARVAGRFLDIDAEGCLVLEVEGRARTFPAGDVHPLTAG